MPPDTDAEVSDKSGNRIFKLVHKELADEKFKEVRSFPNQRDVGAFHVEHSRQLPLTA